MKANKRVLQGNNKEVNYTHIETGSESICFMLSGSGYTYDKPLFYYATMTMLQHKLDVVHIHYTYDQQLLKRPLQEISEAMMDDIQPVIEEVLGKGQYKEQVFLGKSLGTIPMTHDLMKREEFLTSPMILLTPLLNFDTMTEAILNSTHQGLLVIGDKDIRYQAEQIENLSKTNLKIEVIQGANHSLDIEGNDTAGSLSALSNVIEKLQLFLKI
jgi:hypothetical protein